MSDDLDEPGWSRVEPHAYRIDSVSATACADCHRAPTDSIHLDAKHLLPNPGIGQSRYKSIDHHLLALAERAERAENEVARLTRHLEYIEAMGQGGGNVAGTPLAIYARAAILNRLP